MALFSFNKPGTLVITATWKDLNLNSIIGYSQIINGDSSLPLIILNTGKIQFNIGKIQEVQV